MIKTRHPSDNCQLFVFDAINPVGKAVTIPILASTKEEAQKTFDAVYVPHSKLEDKTV